ncbi:calcium-binding protein [Pleurocapsa sp. PCC 7319]|uniref:calcium-binding protein n=1 Tax=Pleurocapsa sp. PCC 7319 TaxID=118161 RepID=UPI0003475E9B|nr:calcium-binding protein [Pleurocapsa sp. PCC 7319]
MLSVNEVFNESYYLETNSEAAEAIENGEFANGLEHFQAVGIDEGLRFSPLINLDYYKIAANPELSDFTSRQALDHLLNQGIEDGRIFSQFVDLEFYKEANPDLSDLSNSEALLHLQNTGLEAGLQFSQFVDLEEYRSFNPELSTQSLSDAFSDLSTFGAPENEGRIRFPLEAGRLSIPGEVDIVTPEMLAGSAEATITYSKSANTITLAVDVEGLPYQLDITRPDDVSTPFNQQPVSVEDGKWQMWFIGNWFDQETYFWYDGVTKDLIASEFDLPEEQPDPNNPVDVNGDGVEDIPFLSTQTAQMVGTPIFEGNLDGTLQIEFTYDYDQILDDRGTGGAYVTGLPYNLDRPEEFGLYYTQGNVPVSEAMSFDEILESIRNDEVGFDTGGMNLAFSLEPDPKPGFLDSRDNTMIAWDAFYPFLTPEGVLADIGAGIYRPQTPSDLQIHQNPPFPAGAIAIEGETEQVFGTLEDDVFDAADPSDEFDGNRDTVFAGAGVDFIDASQARAPLFPATAGRNRIFSGTDNDEVIAGRRDHVNGGPDNDFLDASAGLGHNRLYGNDGDDELLAGIGDHLFGGDGDDILDSSLGTGDNRLYGEDGNDTFFASNSDRFLGGDGDDAFFINDGGDNFLTGGGGADAFWIANGELLTAANTITDFAIDEDVIGVAGLGTASVDELEFSQVGDDAVIALSNFDLAVILNTQVSDLQANGTFVFA